MCVSCAGLRVHAWQEVYGGVLALEGRRCVTVCVAWLGAFAFLLADMQQVIKQQAVQLPLVAYRSCLPNFQAGNVTVHTYPKHTRSLQ